MKYPYRTSVVLALLAAPWGPAVAQKPAEKPAEKSSEQPAADVSALDVAAVTAKWKCKYCPYEDDEGWRGYVEVGAGHVADDALTRGNYTGLQDEGGYVIVNGALRYQDETATERWDLEVEDAGLDSRRVTVTGGRQGRYRLFLEYDELPYWPQEAGRTPFVGVGGTVLTLPADWVPAADTSGFTQLRASERRVEIGQQRDRLSLGAAFVPERRWELSSKYTRDTKSGLKAVGGAIGSTFGTAQAVILPVAVDFTTHQIDVAAAYQGKRLQVNLGYYGSFFENDRRFQTWQNPYVDPASATGSGSLSQPPENEFHQFHLAGAYQFSARTRASARFAFGRMLQDERFLPYTVNSSLQPPSPTGPLFPLPRSSADARVNTYAANVLVTSQLTPRLRLTGKYGYQEYDNKTPRAAYDYVIGDSAVVPSARARGNLPYGFAKDRLELVGAYRWASGLRWQLGAEYEAVERIFQEVRETDEIGLWTKLGGRWGQRSQWSLRLARAERDGDAYQLVPQTEPPQNPLLRKFNQADRDREQLGAQFNHSLSDGLDLGLSADYAKNEYTASRVGLTDGEDVSYTVDLSWAPRRNVNVYGFYTHERLESAQAGAAAFVAPNTAVAPDWRARTEDRIDTVGVGIKWSGLLKKKLDVGVDLVSADSDGRVRVTPGVSYPDLKAEIRTAKLKLDYHARKDLTVRLSYAYEKYEERDWTTDGVATDSVSQVLGLGEATPSYSDAVIGLSLRYRF